MRLVQQKSIKHFLFAIMLQVDCCQEKQGRFELINILEKN